jgi:hypothetical protein
MQLNAITPPTFPTTAPAASSSPNLGQDAVADVLRAGGAGYAAAASKAAVQVDKAAITPFEGVLTLTGLLKGKTANIPVLGKATGLLHTIAGFGLLIAAASVAGAVRAPGNAAHDISNKVADVIDGGATSASSLNWGVATDAATGEEYSELSGIGSVLMNLGVTDGSSQASAGAALAR